MSRLALPDADVEYLPGFLAPAAADLAFAAVRDEVDWEQHHVRLFGRDVPAPRLSSWIGDPGTAYTYSRVRFEPRPWPASVAALRDAIAVRSGFVANSVLANRYRDGRDAMGWHADAEPELGPEPVIASLSLGAPRRFVMRHRARGLKHELMLEPGSLLLMRGRTQSHWQHALPRAGGAGERINLTFRRIFTG
ncbi:MAG TPA: alpha-ketoglutarate-dependent dioxygenase AlkB [Xanthomonadales bacterium]|nr:alpha-ketoglutarate-dependent dioxygenase AlkB [Xanthomonadales bacterium]